MAIGARRLGRLPARVAGALAGGGLVAVGWAALTYDATTAFPGAAALVPVLGTAAVIGAGVASAATLTGAAREVPGGESQKGKETLSERLLGTAPMRWVDGLSYSLYLWHWPLLVAAGAMWGALSPAQGILVVAAAFVPARLTHRLVEAPIHHARVLAVRPRRAFASGSRATANALLAALVTVRAVPEYATADAAPGAAVLAPDPAGDPDGVPADRVPAMTPDRSRSPTTTRTSTRTGASRTPTTPTSPAARTATSTPTVSSRWPATPTPRSGSRHWTSSVSGTAGGSGPTRSRPAGSSPPRSPRTECAQPRAEAVEEAGDEQLVAARELGGVDVVDLSRTICPADERPAVIGNVVVWRDDHHLTATYVRSLASHLDAELRPYLTARRSAA